MAATPPQTSPRRARRSTGHWVGLYRPLAIFGFAALWPLDDAYAARSCADWSAEAVSVEGRVEIRRSTSTDWVELAAGAQVCTGDVLQSRGSSRATLMLPDGNIFRLDEETGTILSISVSAF